MKLHEFAHDSIEEFRKRHDVEQAKARRAVSEYMRDKAIENQADKMTMPGIALGGLTGAALGAIDKRGLGRAYNILGGAAVGGGLGMLVGRAAGRKDERRRILAVKEKMEAGKNLSANLKPALRELAAISEGLKEFAMVRDASGRYVEVPEEGGSKVGTALKVGAGAAAAGGAGYGGYKAYQYGKGNLINQGFQQYRAGGLAPKAALGESASDFAGLGKMGGAKAAFSETGRAGWSALKGASANAVGKTKGGLRGGLLKIAGALK